MGAHVWAPCPASASVHEQSLACSPAACRPGPKPCSMSPIPHKRAVLQRAAQALRVKRRRPETQHGNMHTCTRAHTHTPHEPTSALAAPCSLSASALASAAANEPASSSARACTLCSTCAASKHRHPATLHTNTHSMPLLAGFIQVRPAPEMPCPRWAHPGYNWSCLTLHACTPSGHTATLSGSVWAPSLCRISPRSHASSRARHSSLLLLEERARSVARLRAWHGSLVCMGVWCIWQPLWLGMATQERMHMVQTQWRLHCAHIATPAPA